MSCSAERKKQMSLLTRLFIERTGFSFLRLGDGELRMLLDHQNGTAPRFHFRSFADQMRVNESDLGQLLRSYESCDFLDTYERFAFNRQFFPSLTFHPKQRQLRCLTPDTSQIIFEWTLEELQTLKQNKKVAIAGAEAPLLRELLLEESFRHVAQNIFGEENDVHFIKIPRNGIDYWKNIKSIKKYIKSEMKKTNSTVLLLSLSSAAKIICVQLAEEDGFVTVDFGAALRGLCGSITTGVSSAVSSHFPYFYDVPVEAYIRALDRAYPSLPAWDFIRKVNRQVLVPLLPRRPGSSGRLRYLPCEEFLTSEGEVERFKEDVSLVLGHWKVRNCSMRIFALQDLISMLAHFRLNKLLWRHGDLIDRAVRRLNRRTRFRV